MSALPARAMRITVVFGLTLLGATFWAVSPALGDDVPPWLLERAATDQDWQEVYALDAIQALDLTRAQARAVLPVYEEACKASLDAYQAKATLHPEMIAAFTAFLAEDRLNQGFSQDVERRTAQASHQSRESEESYQQRMIELEQRVGEILSTNQLATAEDYRPNRQAIARRVKAGLTREEQQSRERRRRPWVGDNPYDPLVVAQRELTGLNQAIHSHPGKVARHLLSPAAANVLYLRAEAVQPEVVRRAVEVWRNGTDDYPLEQCRADEETIRQLRAEINAWNLANGLYLSRDQIATIVAAADKVDALRNGRRAGKDRSRVKPAGRDAMIAALEADVEAALNPGQREVLRTYKACLIPPKNLKDPVRVGQASDNTPMTHWLERARQVKGAARLLRLANRVIERESEHFGPLTGAARADRLALLVSTAREAQKMSDTDFELNKEGLSKRIMREDRKEDLQAEIEELRDERGLPGKTANVLLNEQFAAVLRARDQQLAKGLVPRPADMAKGPQADNCDKGCALPKGK